MRPPPPPGSSSRSSGGSRGGPGGIQNDLAHLTETIANATALLQAAGYSNVNGPQSGGPSAPQAQGGDTYDPSYCSVKLPSPQPLAPMDSAIAERLFIVCTPVPPQLY